MIYARDIFRWEFLWTGDMIETEETEDIFDEVFRERDFLKVFTFSNKDAI